MINQIKQQRPIRRQQLKPQRFDALRFKVYTRFCDKCPRLFKTKRKNAYMCGQCSPRSSEIIAKTFHTSKYENKEKFI